MSRSGDEIRVLIIGPTKPLGGMENCVILHASLDLGDGFRLFHLDTKYDPIVRKAKLLKVIYLYWYLLPRMKRIIEEEKIDIIHIHSTSFKNVFKNIEIQKCAKKLGAKSIIHIHGGYFDRFYAGLGEMLRKRLVDGLNFSDALICLSDGWREFYTSTFTETDVFVLENAIDLKPFDKIADGQNYSIDDDEEFKLLFLGRISKMKGVFDLVETAKLLKEKNCHVRFMLAGREEHREINELKHMLREGDIENYFEFAVEVTGPERDWLFAQADGFILPSHAEGMPITVLEAFAVGLPVIATKVGAVPEIIEDSVNGLLAEPENPSSLADAVIKLKSDQELRKNMALRGRELVKARFSADRWVTDLRKIYGEVAGEI